MRLVLYRIRRGRALTENLLANLFREFGARSGFCARWIGNSRRRSDRLKIFGSTYYGK